MKNRFEILYDSKTRIEFKRGVICEISIKKNKSVYSSVSHRVERGIHRSPNVALKVHQIDAFNFNI